MNTRKQPTGNSKPQTDNAKTANDVEKKAAPPVPTTPTGNDNMATPPVSAAGNGKNNGGANAIVPAISAPQIRDGFDVPDDPSESGTVIGQIEKFAKGDRTTGGAPADLKRRLLAIDTLHCLRRWQNNQVIAEIHDRPLPKVDDLNKEIPENEWEIDQKSGKPRPPWEHTHTVYLWDLDTGKKSTFLTSSVGGAIAVSDLKEQVRSMRRLRGELIYPQVELGSAPMKSKKFGMLKKPDFKIVGWLNLNEMAPLAQIATDAAPPADDDEDSKQWGT